MAGKPWYADHPEYVADWDVARDDDGNPITITPAQGHAVLRAMRVLKMVEKAEGGSCDGIYEKSRLLGRMLYEGLPPTKTKPPFDMGAPNWNLLPEGEPFLTPEERAQRIHEEHQRFVEGFNVRDLSGEDLGPHDDEESLTVWSYFEAGKRRYAWSCEHGYHFANFSSFDFLMNHMRAHLKRHAVPKPPEIGHLLKQRLLDAGLAEEAAVELLNLAEAEAIRMRQERANYCWQCGARYEVVQKFPGPVKLPTCTCLEDATEREVQRRFPLGRDEDSQK